MPLITYDITVTIEDSNGDPVEGATVTSRLTKTDTDQADNIFVQKETYVEQTDENGQAVFSLWPNTRGTAGSQYRFKAYGAEGQIFNLLATVQEQNDNLEDITSLEPPTSRSFPVRSVQGITGDSATGNVELDPDDFDDTGTTNKFTTAGEITKLAGIETGADVTDAANVNAAGAVMESDYNAQTVLIAVADNTPLPVTIGASQFVGRKASGDAGVMSASEARTVLNVEDGADVTDAANVASVIAGVSTKATPVSNDGLALIDSEASNVLKRLLWSALISNLTASQAQQETGSSTSVFVSPGRQHFHPSAAKFWLKGGVTANILASYNIASLADTGTGDLGVVIANDISGAEYCVVTGGERTSSTGTATLARDISIKVGTLAAGGFSLECWDKTATTNVIKDPTTWHCVGFGDL